MTEVNRLLLATALAGGYVLGRTKKARLALAAASYVAGRQYGVEPRKLVAQGRKWLGEVPQVAELGEQVRGELMAAGREAVSAAADRRLASFADALHERTLRLESAGEEGQGEDDEEEPEEEPAAEASKARGGAERGRKASGTGNASGKKSAGRTGNDGQAGDRRRGTAGKTAPSDKRPAKKATGKTPSRQRAPATRKKASPHAEHRR